MTPIRRAVARWAVRRVIRLSLTAHALMMRVAGAVRRSRREAGARGYEVLLTGTFHSDNWILSHLIPLARARLCAGVRVVTTYSIPAIDKVTVISPPPWLVGVVGAVPARLATFLWVGLRTRPHFVGGFHLLFNGLAAALLGRVVGARSIYFCVGGPAEVLQGGIASENRLFERLEVPDAVVERQLVRAVRDFDLVVTMGSGAREFFRERGATGTLEIVPGGLDVRKFSPAAEPPQVDMIFVGRLSPIKRVDLFLHSVAMVREALPGARAVIVGDGAMRPALESLARELGLAGCVRFAGRQSGIEAWLRNAKVFMLTSDSEGLSLALIEAMLCGVPAVVSDVGDLGDLVEDGRNGYLVRERTPDEFAARALQILRDEGTRRRLATQARAAALRYGVDACAQVWDRVLGAFDRPGQGLPAGKAQSG